MHQMETIIVWPDAKANYLSEKHHFYGEWQKKRKIPPKRDRFHFLYCPTSKTPPMNFISVCRRLGTCSRWCACSRTVWSWGPSTAGSLTSSRPPAPGSIGTCAPPAGGRATRRRWEATQRGGGEMGNEPRPSVQNKSIKSSNERVCAPHLGSDAHWPWHAGMWMTAVQLSTVTLRLVTLTAQPRLPGFREKIVTSES